MEYLTHSLIDESEALQIVNKLKTEKSSWQDGKKTAGSHAAEIKSNSSDLPCFASKPFAPASSPNRKFLSSLF